MKLKYPTNREYYDKWHDMIRRCYDPRRPEYKNYGGRGIKVCDRWLNSLDRFAEDIGKPPTPKHTLDRIDNDGNYEPSNTRWITRAEQNRNRRKVYRSSRSGVNGVTWDKRYNNWQVYLNRRSGRTWLGYAKNIGEAIAMQNVGDLDV